MSNVENNDKQQLRPEDRHSTVSNAKTLPRPCPYPCPRYRPWPEAKAYHVKMQAHPGRILSRNAS